MATILPAIIHISHQIPLRENDGPIGVILAPTIETAHEFKQIASRYCDLLNIKCSSLTQKILKSRMQIKGNYELLITTPGSLYESLAMNLLDLHRCSYFAVYEFDRMLELSLEDEIQQINSQLRPDCQKLIWNTRWNGEIRNYVIEILNEYVELNVGSSFAKCYKNENIEQIVRVSDEENKKQIFLEFIKQIINSNQQKTLVFTETKQCANRISKILQKEGYSCDSLHNDKTKEQRNQTLTAFHNDNIKFLVLTDVAARNLDLSKASNIINYDLPLTISDYLQRINPTYRSNEMKIKAYSILTEENGYLVDEFIEMLRNSNQAIDPALFILQAANIDSDDEFSFAIPHETGFTKYTIDKNL